MNLMDIQVAYQHTLAPADAFEADPIGYFIVHVTKKHTIRMEHYTPDDMPDLVLEPPPGTPISRLAEALRQEIVRRWPAIRVDHMGYISAELGRAQCAIEWEHEYTQL